MTTPWASQSAPTDGPKIEPDDSVHLEGLTRKVADSEVSENSDDSPLNPRNWPLWKKNAQILMIAFHSMMSTFMAAGIVLAFDEFAEDYNVSVASASYLTSFQILALGLAPLVWRPVANVYGRYPVCLFSVLGSMACNIGGARCTTYGAQMATRVLTAILISPPSGIGSGVVTDLCEPGERGKKIGWWTLMIVMGTPAGPFFMGFVVKHIGVQWIFWIFAIINFCQFLAYLAIGDETSYNPAGKEAAATGLRKMIPRQITPNKIRLGDLVAPLTLVKHPRVLVAALAHAVFFCYGNIALIVEMPISYGQKFDFDGQQIGLQFIAIIIGCVLGEQLSGPFSDWTSKRIRESRGYGQPADRLWLFYVGYATFAAGMLVWGFQLQKTTSWNVTPCVGSAIASFGNQMQTTILTTFAVESSKERSTDTGVFISLCRQVYGFSRPQHPVLHWTTNQKSHFMAPCSKMDCNQETKNMQIPPSEIRDAFAKAMSKMFAKEVPMYSKLTALVDHVNKKTLQADETLRSSLRATDDLGRISCERHGAIRLGTAKELATIKRILSIMGMFPTGYYDLSAAGIPVHATCFRPHDATELSKNPFRLFVSLLRPELIESDALRARVVSIISRRQIFNAQILQLLKTFDKNGGMNHLESEELVKEAVNIFQWKNEASIAKADYEKLMEEGAVLADIVAFPNPHINHLTPRTLDIDSVQSTMQEWGIPFKDCIEGPPKRKCPIVLRQTSFKAVEEDVSFPAAEFLSNDTIEPLSVRRGYHTARFGEIEQRGAALTRKGRSYYDHLLRLALEKEVTALDMNAYAAIFSKFPDTWDELRLQGLVWFKYYVPAIITHDRPPHLGAFNLNKLVDAGWIKYEPIVYEDFLPISAAGIFRSNISGQGKSSRRVLTDLSIDSKALFEEALGSKVSDEFKIYENIEKESITRCRELYERDWDTR